MKKAISKIFALGCLLSAMLSVQSCESGRSYSELLDDENAAVNRFLVDQNVVPSIPADTVFEVGADAPYYQIDNEGNIYMQVLSLGTGPMATDNQLIYFRFERYNLSNYRGDMSELASEGNQDDLTQAPTSFRYQNFTLPSSSQWGSGLQLPLSLIPIDSEINLVVKSQYGWSSEISYVVPYLYHVRYYLPQI